MIRALGIAAVALNLRFAAWHMLCNHMRLDPQDHQRLVDEWQIRVDAERARFLKRHGREATR